MIQILKCSEVSKADIFARNMPAADVADVVSEIIETVREKGDAALYEYSRKFDHADLQSLQVSEEEMQEALAAMSPEFLAILQQAAANIRKFHEKQVRNSFVINDTEGIVMGQKVIPIETAGLYVPGGTASYPSTVLMDAIPSRRTRSGRLSRVIGSAATKTG